MCGNANDHVIIGVKLMETMEKMQKVEMVERAHGLDVGGSVSNEG